MNEHSDNDGGEMADDRRQFFRVDDSIRVNICTLSEPEAHARRTQGLADAPHSFTLMSSLSAISAQTAINLRRIENHDPDIAAYLRAIDQKIEVLGRAFLNQEPELMGIPARSVNLSAGGMALDVQQSYAPGTSVEVKMLLFPSFSGLLTLGRVIGCVPIPPAQMHEDYAFNLRIEFDAMSDTDCDILMRHIVRRQSDALRRRQQGI